MLISSTGVASKEFGLLLSLAAILIARTWLDIWFSGFNGLVVRSIVSRDKALFIKSAIFTFGLMMWPMVRYFNFYFELIFCFFSPL